MPARRGCICAAIAAAHLQRAVLAAGDGIASCWVTVIYPGVWKAGQLAGEVRGAAAVAAA